MDKELFRRKENFAIKFGQESIFSYDTESWDSAMIKQIIYGGGLFVSKKMVILNGVPVDAAAKLSAEKKAQMDAFLDDFLAREGKIPEETLLVFVSGKPDKRLKLYKFLERNAVVKSFDQYKESELKDFIISQLQGIYIPNDIVEYFLLKVGPNLYRLWFECEKLKTRCAVRHVSTIDQDLVDKVVFGQVETNIFSLLETLFTQQKKSLLLIDKIQAEGEDWNSFAGMLYRSLKFSLFMVDLVRNGAKDSKEIASLMSSNPWQVSKSLKQISQLQSQYDSMLSFFRQLVRLDYGIKTGLYPDTYFWLGVKKIIT